MAGRHESYRIPTPPAARCDGSGTIKWDTGGPAARCPGCPACKPEPKDGADEAADAIEIDFVYQASPDDPNYAVIDEQASERKIRAAITAAIRADREKQAARPRSDPVSIGNAAINAIIAGSLFRISGQELDSNVIVWSANAAEQIGEAVNRIGEPS